ncbi:unnamed protein product [Triticum turgidum subsp. durum]|uniref:Nitrile-specifier protein 5 n=1 Tax=Triticum turgidum subsp. durum TaxID=4567 RepID=A0A9R0X6I8_TRITD|nr:unnamed protein product [Triticum turgidum subsp. durum]
MAGTGSTWLLLEQKGAGPGARSSHAITLVGGTAYSFGGEFTPRLPVDNTMYAFDLKAQSWSALHAAGEVPPPRVGVTMASVGATVWVVYGFSGDAELDDVHSYDPATGEWAVVDTTGDKPTPRSVLCAAGVGKHVVVFGGEVDPSDLGHLGAGKFSAEAFVLDTDTGAWAKLDDAGSGHHPGPRGWCAFSAGALDGRRGMLVYGGNSPTNDRLGDMFLFTPLLA